MPKQVKKSNAFVSNIKSQSRAKKVLLGVAVVMVVALVGFLGFSTYKARNLKAQAAGWTQLYNVNGYAAAACKTSNRFGTFVRIVVSKPAWRNASYTIGMEGQNAHANIWWMNQVAGIERSVGYLDWTKKIQATIDGVTDPNNRWQVVTLRDC